MDNNNQMVVSPDEQPSTQQQQAPPFDIGAIFKTVQMLTQKVTSELKQEGGEDGKPPDFAKVFSSIGKVLAEPSEEMDEVKSTFSKLGKGGLGGGDGLGGGAGGLNFGSIFSSIMKQQQPQTADNVQATHQDETPATQQPQEPLLPVGEKTVVLEVTEQELNEGITKKFTIDVAEKGAASDVFALELQLEKGKYFYKFFLKERNLNLSFLLDLK